MTPKKRESIIDRVRKLMAVAAPDSGATIHEREQAQRRAAALMTEHDLSTFDLDDADKGAIGQDADTVEGMTEQWRGELAGRIVAAMGGDWYLTRHSRTRVGYTLVGRPETIEFARVLTAALIPYLEIECEAGYQRAIKAGATGTCSRCDGLGETRRVIGGGYTDTLHECPTCHGTGVVPLNARVFRREFYDAAGRRIAGRLREQRRKTANEVRGKGTGAELVKSDQAAIERFYDQIGLKLRSESGRTTGGAAAGRAHGRDAGDRADLAPGSKVGAGRGALPRGKS